MKKRVHNKSTGRDYSKDKLYNKKTVKDRALRNAARREMTEFLTKKHGASKAKKLMRNMDVDHKKPVSQGGTNRLSNLRLQSKSKNRSRANL